MNDYLGVDRQSPLPEFELNFLSEKFGLKIDCQEFAQAMDQRDPLKEFRKEFCIPKKNVGLIEGKEVEAKEVVYLSGHSLGPKPKRADHYSYMVLKNWGERGVESHFRGFLPAASCEDYCKDQMARIVGAEPVDIAIMNGLTVNLHLMMSAFYRPNSKRWKILMEEKAFPSDRFAAESQIALHGFDPKTGLILVQPRKGENCIRLEDCLRKIETDGEEIALILWPGVQYYTGQHFDSQRIVQAGHEKGCIVGLDLAHAVGNTEVRLNHWNPDFAVWCTYKYLNSGPGGIGAIYVNEKHTTNKSSLTSLRGWWGNDPETKFDMDSEFEPCEGADRFKLSNTSPLLIGNLKSSLEIFDEAGMARILQKQFLLTGYLEYLIKRRLPGVTIITPTHPSERGSQLSLLFTENLAFIKHELDKKGVMCDVRQPSVIRLATSPLYNTYGDVLSFVNMLCSIIRNLKRNNKLVI